MVQCSPSVAASGQPPAPMTADDETAMRAWLAHIEETDPDTITEVLDPCRTDAGAREYFIGRAGEVPRASQKEHLTSSTSSTKVTVDGYDYQPPFCDPKVISEK